MATNTVVLRGDSSSLTVKSTNVTGLDPLEFQVGSFRSTPEERRVATLQLVTAGGTKVFKLRLEFTSGQFVEHTISGKPIYADTSASGLRVEA